MEEFKEEIDEEFCVCDGKKEEGIVGGGKKIRKNSQSSDQIL